MRHYLAGFGSLVLVVGLAACGDDDGGGSDTDAGGNADGGGLDGATVGDGGAGAMDGAVEGLDGGVMLPGGEICYPAPCQGQYRQCGNCIDDDGDGLYDGKDPDCLGACDNNEAGYSTGIPGGDSAPCKLDCYFDTDQGSGNDKCEWDARCDPLEPDPLATCSYQNPPPPNARCPGGPALPDGGFADPETTQDPACLDFCAPLTPNGCDCFGCCELPAESGRFVFIGTVDEAGQPTCDPESAEDDERCHPCTPVENCYNDCGRCELSLGKGVDDLPEDSFPDPADAGTPTDDAGMPGDGGVVDPPTCDDGRQLCDVPGTGPCPEGLFCLTGCCTFFG